MSLVPVGEDTYDYQKNCAQAAAKKWKDSESDTEHNKTSGIGVLTSSNTKTFQYCFLLARRIRPDMSDDRWFKILQHFAKHVKDSYQVNTTLSSTTAAVLANNSSVNSIPNRYALVAQTALLDEAKTLHSIDVTRDRRDQAKLDFMNMYGNISNVTQLAKDRLSVLTNERKSEFCNIFFIFSINPSPAKTDETSTFPSCGKVS